MVAKRAAMLMANDMQQQTAAAKQLAFHFIPYWVARWPLPEWAERKRNENELKRPLLLYSKPYYVFRLMITNNARSNYMCVDALFHQWLYSCCSHRTSLCCIQHQTPKLFTSSIGISIVRFCSQLQVNIYCIARFKYRKLEKKQFWRYLNNNIFFHIVTVEK